MKRMIRKEITQVYSCDEESVENFKRRRALSPFSILDASSRLFFERIVNVKKTPEFVFITKARSKER